MSVLSQLLDGFTEVVTPTNLALAFIGCVLGTLVGILPGFGPASALSLLLPVTFSLGPVPALIMLAAILYGSSYGGTITAVLLNVPGETSSIATTFDGYAMAKQGRAGPALAIAAIGSFVGCIGGLIGFVLLAEPLSRIALSFGPVEFFALTILGMTLVVGLAGASITKALVTACLGLIVTLIGLDPMSGTPRFTFGTPELFDGVNLVAMVMGLYGVSELLTNIDHSTESARALPVGRIWPTRDDMRRSIGPICRGTPVGFLFGLLPGSPGATTSFASYLLERSISKRKDEFGKGAIEGVAGPETANNSLQIAGMVPLFTLGIPTSASTAILMGAFLINGLAPGPLLFEKNPEIVWAIIASMFVGNIMLLILNLPLVRIWVAILKVPYSYLYAFIFGFMILGAYTLAGSIFNVSVMLLFGVIGYVLRKLDFPLAPFALTLVLGEYMESALRRSLTLSHGSPSIFFTSPISATFLGIAVIALTGVLSMRILARRRTRRGTK